MYMTDHMHVREILSNSVRSTDLGSETVPVDGIDDEGDVVVVEVDPDEVDRCRTELTRLALQAIPTGSAANRSSSGDKTPFYCGDCGRETCGHITVGSKGAIHHYL